MTLTDERPVDALLEVHDVTVRFGDQRRWRSGDDVFVAVNQASLSIGHGETVGLVGESGSGKTTLGRVILGLQAADGAGAVNFNGVNLLAQRKLTIEQRARIQVVFQNPYAALNPSFTIAELIGEGLQLHGNLRGAACEARIAELLEAVGLHANAMHRLPHEFSGGQRQRVALARALAPEPDLIVLDEPISSLDVSTQNQIITLLEEIQQRTGVAYLLIAHDLALVQHASDRVAVMYAGHILETGPAAAVWHTPRHPYTKMLLDAIPLPDPQHQQLRRSARQDVPTSRIDLRPHDEPGCPFASRCVHATSTCRVMPPSTSFDDGVSVRCHLYA